ncbi:MAG: TAXI family TRAP transporter solute-binding subunit [Gammaproteobacteria bacterium]|nr:TAXI family TRAP transporter solute-binding subunit [Gammaproteobacteria bacterium]
MNIKVLLAGVFLLNGWAVANAAEITIGTGSQAGVYYQVGRDICRLVNKSSNAHGVTCKSHISNGSVSNLNDVRSGALSLGVVQSDTQYYAANGSKLFQDPTPDKELRALFSVHPEPFTLVARRDSNIQGLDDLVGKRVNIGNPGSGQRATMEVVMQAKGWDKQIFSLANELPAWQQSMALCHDRVQAMVYTVGHPNPSVAKATSLCKAKIVEVSGPEIDRLVDEYPFYVHSTIPGGIYEANPDPVKTFGVNATLVASSKLDDDLVYTVVKTVFDNLETFKSMHPAFSLLQKERMISEGLSVPLHEGARRYFLEQGLITK